MAALPRSWCIISAQLTGGRFFCLWISVLSKQKQQVPEHLRPASPPSWSRQTIVAQETEGASSLHVPGPVGQTDRRQSQIPGACGAVSAQLIRIPPDTQPLSQSFVFSDASVPSPV